jgi:hypothetical protein
MSSPANHDLLAIVKGARNGLVYGAKIRQCPSDRAAIEPIFPLEKHC